MFNKLFTLLAAVTLITATGCFAGSSDEELERPDGAGLVDGIINTGGDLGGGGVVNDGGDNGGGTVNQNQAPSVDAGSSANLQIALGDADVGMDLAGNVTDDGLGGALSYSWEVISGPAGGAAIADRNDMRSRVTFSQEGTYVLRLMASDGELSSSRDITITVTRELPPPPNQAPTARITGPTTGQMAHDATSITLSFSGTTSSDPENDALTYAWTSAGTVQSASASATNVTFNGTGTFEVRLVVTDDEGASSAAAVHRVTIGQDDPPPPNQQPVARITGTTSAAMDHDAASITLSYSGTTSSDPENSALTYSWSSTGNVASANASTTNVTFNGPGDYTVSLTVNDGELDSSVARVNVTITRNPPPPNQAPTARLTGPSNAEIAHDATSIALDFDASGSSDPENDALTYAWSANNGATVPAGSTSTKSITFPSEGNYVVSLSVSDGNGNNHATQMNVTITRGDAPPPPPEDRDVTFAWNPPEGATEGAGEGEIAGYTIQCGQSSRNYNRTIDLPNGNYAVEQNGDRTATVSLNTGNDTHCAATAYNEQGDSSDIGTAGYSNEVQPFAG